MSEQERSDDTGRLVSVVVDGQRFHRADGGELNTAQRLIVAEQLVREALAENARLGEELDETDRALSDVNRGSVRMEGQRDEARAEVRSLRGVVQAAREQCAEMEATGVGLLHAWAHTIREEMAAAAADAPQPAEPPTRCEHNKTARHDVFGRNATWIGTCPGPSPAVLPQPSKDQR